MMTMRYERTAFGLGEVPLRLGLARQKNRYQLLLRRDLHDRQRKTRQLDHPLWR
jgi:hypothetical protein